MGKNKKGKASGRKIISFFPEQFPGAEETDRELLESLKQEADEVERELQDDPDLAEITPPKDMYARIVAQLKEMGVWEEDEGKNQGEPEAPGKDEKSGRDEESDKDKEPEKSEEQRKYRGQIISKESENRIEQGEDGSRKKYEESGNGEKQGKSREPEEREDQIKCRELEIVGELQNSEESENCARRGKRVHQETLGSPETGAEQGEITREPETGAEQGKITEEPETGAEQGKITREPETGAEQGKPAEEPKSVGKSSDGADEDSICGRGDIYQMLSESEQEALELGRKIQRKRELRLGRIHRWQKCWKHCGMTAAVLVLVFGIAMTSEANRKFVGRVWKTVKTGISFKLTLIGIEEADSSYTISEKEIEDMEKIQETLGVSPVDFRYLPAGVKYIGYEIQEQNLSATVFYQCDSMMFSVILEKDESHEKDYYIQDEEAFLADTVITDQDIKVEIWKTVSNQDEEILYLANCWYGDCSYTIMCIPSLAEIKKIAENMCFQN